MSELLNLGFSMSATGSLKLLKSCARFYVYGIVVFLEESQ